MVVQRSPKPLAWVRFPPSLPRRSRTTWPATWWSLQALSQESVYNKQQEAGHALAHDGTKAPLEGVLLSSCNPQTVIDGEYTIWNGVGMYYFYILQSYKNKNWFYKGSSRDLRRRFSQHNNGEVDATRPYRPLRIAYYEAYISEKAARMREHNVKHSGSISVPLLRRIKVSLDDEI